jgi:hypothetical protein
MPDENNERDIAIVGMGPRGLAVLERLLIQLDRQPPEMKTRIWTFDPGEPGAGRIWRTTQPEWFMMNTTAGELTLYSGGPDSGPARAGAGPSLVEWLRQQPGHPWANLGPDDYAPRALYGQYLTSVFDNLTANAPPNVSIIPSRSSILRVERFGEKRMLVRDRDKYVLPMDKVILTTGHTHNLPSDFEQQLSRFAETNGLRYLRGDSAAEMPLDDIAPGEQVGMLGLGLGFLDVLMSLTVGRGGRFEPDGEDDLRYVPSGREPHVVAGSRSGMVIRGRGRNQKEPTYRYQPVFVTDATITAARRRAQLRDGSAQLSFLRDVLPLLQLEAEHVYYANHVRRQSGPRAADRFAARHRRLADRGPAARRELLTEFGVAEIPQLNLEELGRPFQEASFSDPDAFHGHLLDLMKSDFTEASAGNVEGPMKAALDTLRDIRSTVRLAVDYGGLRSGSHEDEFLGWFNPIYAMIATGPPYFRVAQARPVRPGVQPGARLAARGHHVHRRPHPQGRRRARRRPADPAAPGGRPHLRVRQHRPHHRRAVPHRRDRGHPAALPRAGPRRAARPAPVRVRHPHREHPLVQPGRERAARAAHRVPHRCRRHRR